MGDKAEEENVELLVGELQDALEIFIRQRERAIKTLKQIAKKVNENQRDGNIAKIIGSSAGIAGAIAAVVSIPLTGGASLVALGTGAVLGIGGAATGIGAEVKVRVTEGDLLKKARNILDSDQREAENLASLLERIKVRLDEIVRLGIRVSLGSSAGVVAALAQIAPKVVTICPRTGRAVIGGLTTAGKFVKGAGVVLGVVLIPFEIWAIVDNVEEIGKGSKAAKAIYDVVKQLEENLEKLRALRR